MDLDSTIVAIATPPGRGGSGVVRLSGPESLCIAAALFSPRSGKPLAAGRASFGLLRDSESGELMDEAVATYFAAPHSYTTEDVVELSCHGSPVLLGRVVQMAVALGARLAEPGEFTQRAFLKGRMDLTQAEAVRDLIDAQTAYQAKVAARQLHGELAHAVAPVKAQLVALIARLEAGIDFADDDVEVLPAAAVTSALAPIATRLGELERSFRLGRLVHEGLTLAIVGRPNVGKSSLFNRLVERERAIVTATPGTTRDLVTENVSIGGIPVRMVDTAGIREARDEVEQIGILKSRQALAEADLALVVLEAGAALETIECELIAEVEELPVILVCNKADLAAGAGKATNSFGYLQTAPPPPGLPAEFCGLPRLLTSALTGEGIAELRQAILVTMGGANPAEGAIITNLRQQQKVYDAVVALDRATKATEEATPHEMLLVDLYAALHALDELTGATTSDDILNLIFSTFCIGK
jgi:tRNA modification GTPase